MTSSKALYNYFLTLPIEDAFHTEPTSHDNGWLVWDGIGVDKSLRLEVYYTYHGRMFLVREVVLLMGSSRQPLAGNIPSEFIRKMETAAKTIPCGVLKKYLEKIPPTPQVTVTQNIDVKLADGKSLVDALNKKPKWWHRLRSH